MLYISGDSYQKSSKVPKFISNKENPIFHLITYNRYTILFQSYSSLEEVNVELGSSLHRENVLDKNIALGSTRDLPLYTFATSD